MFNTFKSNFVLSLFVFPLMFAMAFLFDTDMTFRIWMGTFALWLVTLTCLLLDNVWKIAFKYPELPLYTNDELQQIDEAVGSNPVYMNYILKMQSY